MIAPLRDFLAVCELAIYLISRVPIRTIAGMRYYRLFAEPWLAHSAVHSQPKVRVYWSFWYLRATVCVPIEQCILDYAELLWVNLVPRFFVEHQYVETGAHYSIRGISFCEPFICARLLQSSLYIPSEDILRAQSVIYSSKCHDADGRIDLKFEKIATPTSSA